MNTEEFIVSFEAIEVAFGDNTGKWHTRFSIRRGGKVIYYGSGKGFFLSRIDAEKAAASEVCRVLSNGARLLY